MCISHGFLPPASASRYAPATPHSTADSTLCPNASPRPTAHPSGVRRWTQPLSVRQIAQTLQAEYEMAETEIPVLGISLPQTILNWKTVSTTYVHVPYIRSCKTSGLLWTEYKFLIFGVLKPVLKWQHPVCRSVRNSKCT